MIPSSRHLYVWNIAPDVGRNDLVQFFRHLGIFIEGKDIVRPKWRDGRPKNFAFIEFSSGTERNRAIEAANGRWLGGKRIGAEAYKGLPHGLTGRSEHSKPAGLPEGVSVTLADRTPKA